MWDVPPFCWEVRLYILYYIRFTLPAGPVLHCTTECCSKCPRCCFRCSNSPQRDSSSSKKEVPKTGKKCCTRNSWSQTFSEWKRWSKLQGILVQAVLNLLFQATLCKPKVLDIFSQVNDLDKSLASSRCQIKEMCTHCIIFSRSLYVSSLVMLALHFSQGGLFPGSRQASREGL